MYIYSSDDLRKFCYMCVYIYNNSYSFLPYTGCSKVIGTNFAH